MLVSWGYRAVARRVVTEEEVLDRLKIPCIISPSTEVLEKLGPPRGEPAAHINDVVDDCQVGMDRSGRK